MNGTIIIFIMELIGTIAFAISGSLIAVRRSLDLFGGGIIRDILVYSTPYVLTKDIYALASVIGSTVYYLIRINSNKIVALIVAMSIIVIIRLLAAKYHWRLPKIILKN